MEPTQQKLWIYFTETWHIPLMASDENWIINKDSPVFALTTLEL